MPIKLFLFRLPIKLAIPSMLVLQSNTLITGGNILNMLENINLVQKYCNTKLFTQAIIITEMRKI